MQSLPYFSITCTWCRLKRLRSMYGWLLDVTSLPIYFHFFPQLTYISLSNMCNGKSGCLLSYPSYHAIHRVPSINAKCRSILVNLYYWSECRSIKIKCFGSIPGFWSALIGIEHCFRVNWEFTWFVRESLMEWWYFLSFTTWYFRTRTTEILQDVLHNKNINAHCETINHGDVPEKR